MDYCGFDGIGFSMGLFGLGNGWVRRGHHRWGWVEVGFWVVEWLGGFGWLGGLGRLRWGFVWLSLWRWWCFAGNNGVGLWFFNSGYSGFWVGNGGDSGGHGGLDGGGCFRWWLAVVVQTVEVGGSYKPTVPNCGG